MLHSSPFSACTIAENYGRMISPESHSRAGRTRSQLPRAEGRRRQRESGAPPRPFQDDDFTTTYIPRHYHFTATATAARARPPSFGLAEAVVDRLYFGRVDEARARAPR